jgi:hypothetical protein
MWCYVPVYAHEEEEEECICTSQKYIITIFSPHIIKTELAWISEVALTLIEVR